MSTSEITLDKDVFKALAGDTRISVLKALLLRRKTQSELAKEIGVAAPTIKEHVDILARAGLVREMDDGHKWKYIELTVKGKALLQPADKRILVLLGSSIVGVMGAAYLLSQRFLPWVNGPGANEGFSSMATTANDTLMPAAPEVARNVSQLGMEWFSTGMLFESLVLGISLILFGVAIGMWIKHTF
ncbi:MAG: winged helix-turn-helix domain-containing protein [Candidatus Diapherotrites archaeon]|nr:winged helix-turn-helix domain-containing protein [Candidatus Diapherotrites archaeon]MDZ4256342.1 winged helix-turn-helix domain-containing protein [archaeon]